MQKHNLKFLKKRKEKKKLTRLYTSPFFPDFISRQKRSLRTWLSSLLSNELKVVYKSHILRTTAYPLNVTSLFSFVNVVSSYGKKQQVFKQNPSEIGITIEIKFPILLIKLRSLKNTVYIIKNQTLRGVLFTVSSRLFSVRVVSGYLASAPLQLVELFGITIRQTLYDLVDNTHTTEHFV